MSEFRYGRLMEVKEKLLEHKQVEIELAVAAVNAISREISDLEREVETSYSDMAGRCLTGNELSVLVGYIAYLDGKKARLHDNRAERTNRVKVLKAELSALEIELKMLEKLKSKIQSAAKKDRNKKEQKLMDAIALRIERD